MKRCCKMKIKKLVKEIKESSIIYSAEDLTGCSDAGYDCEDVNDVLKKFLQEIEK